METMRFVGLDVHRFTIALACADPAGDVRSHGTIPNTPETLVRALRKLGPLAALRVAYEAGPCGYAIYRLLTAHGIECRVVAPSLVPVRAGDRVKTDRRDALKLARLLRAGELTAVWVPDAATEALRDLSRTRDAAGKDLRRARHRVAKFLLRHGIEPPPGVRNWSAAYWTWLRQRHWDDAVLGLVYRDLLSEVERQLERVHELDAQLRAAVPAAAPAFQRVVAALQALRGFALGTAVTVATEIGRFDRFPSPRPLMAYCGLVPREHSSGPHISRGGITKTGNGHLRRVLIEASWQYRHAPATWAELRKRQAGLPAAIRAHARRAQERLHLRYRRFTARGRTTPATITAIARELVGFVWAIARTAEAAPFDV